MSAVWFGEVVRSCVVLLELLYLAWGQFLASQAIKWPTLGLAPVGKPMHRK